jgi:hypothetical protein
MTSTLTQQGGMHRTLHKLDRTIQQGKSNKGNQFGEGLNPANLLGWWVLLGFSRGVFPMPIPGSTTHIKSPAAALGCG